MNTVWENHQHVQNLTCAPVNHPPTCSKRVSSVSKPTVHRVNTVLATFPKRFHTVCERVPACQTSTQRVPDVYVPCKYRAQRVCSDRPALFYRATSVCLPYPPPLWRHDWYNKESESEPDNIKCPITCFQSVGNKIINTNFYCNTYFWMHVLHSIMAYSLCIWHGNTTCLDNYYFEKWPTFRSKFYIFIANVHRDCDFSSSNYLVFTINKNPSYYLHLLTNNFIWKYNWTVFQYENYFISNILIL